MGRGPKACWMGRRGRRGGGGESLHAHKPGGFQRILTQRVSDEAGGPAWQRDASQGLETPSLGFCPHRLSPTLDLGRASIPTITTILYWGPNSGPAPEPGTRLCDTATPHRPLPPHSTDEETEAETPGPGAQGCTARQEPSSQGPRRFLLHLSRPLARSLTSNEFYNL